MAAQRGIGAARLAMGAPQVPQAQTLVLKEEGHIALRHPFIDLGQGTRSLTFGLTRPRLRDSEPPGGLSRDHPSLWEHGFFPCPWVSRLHSLSQHHK
jgi:hypothetical protein